MHLYDNVAKRYGALTQGARPSYGPFLCFSFLFHLLMLLLIQNGDFFRPAPRELPNDFVQLVDPEALAPPPKRQKGILFGTDRPEDLKSIPPAKETRLPPIPKSTAPGAVPEIKSSIRRAPLQANPAPLSPPEPIAPITPPSVSSDPRMAETKPKPLPSLPPGNEERIEADPSSRPRGLPGLPGLPFADAKNLDRLAKVFSDRDQRPKDTLSLNTEDLKYFSYLLKVKNKIEYIWRYPAAAADRGIEGDLLLSFTIHRDGGVSGVSIASSSGYEVLDQEAARAIQAASPFPSLPETWNEDQITIAGHFLYFNRYAYIR